MKRFIVALSIALAFTSCTRYNVTIDVVYTDGSKEQLGFYRTKGDNSPYLKNGCLMFQGAQRCGVRSFTWTRKEVE